MPQQSFLILYKLYMHMCWFQMTVYSCHQFSWRPRAAGVMSDRTRLCCLAEMRDSQHGEIRKGRLMQGEDQKKLDVVSNDVFCNALRSSGRTGTIASEEEDVPVAVEETNSGTTPPLPSSWGRFLGIDGQWLVSLLPGC